MRLPNGLQATENCQTCDLHSEDFFCRLSPEASQALESIKLTNIYPKGAVLFFEEQSPRGVFMLCRGRVKLSVCSADGKMLILRIAEPGELLGLSAVVSDRLYKATAETLETCQVNFIRKEDFLSFLREHGEACFRVAQHLSQNYHTAYVQIRSLGLSHSALEKLARLLLDWCRGNGTQTEQGIRLKLGLTHEEIAKMIGTSRETVSRLFSELKGREAIHLKGSTLIIRDTAALEAITN
ncbi:MAG: Crp/Fnr family transcriptional regulator [Acidobacteria bacterium]|nr:MAG: Crp/Fnr family transcriptional regulator [Acidobacteriota bacterium]